MQDSQCQVLYREAVSEVRGGLRRWASYHLWQLGASHCIISSWCSSSLLVLVLFGVHSAAASAILLLILAATINTTTEFIGSLNYAIPLGIRIDEKTGTLHGGTDIFYPGLAIGY